MFMADQNPLAGAAHAMLVIVFLEALQAGEYRGVFFWLCFLCAECVVGEGV